MPKVSAPFMERTEPSMNRALYRPPVCRLPGMPLPSPSPDGLLFTQFVVAVFGHDQKLLAKNEWPTGFIVQPSFVVSLRKVIPPAVSATPMVLLVPSVIPRMGRPFPVPLL